jgi:hypothetical protein
MKLRNPQTLMINYEGQDYEARYHASGGIIEVEVRWGDGLGLKTERSLGDWSAAVVARMTALGALIGAKQRGELNQANVP